MLRVSASWFASRFAQVRTIGAMPPKVIDIDGRPAGTGRFPAICAPLVGRTMQRLLDEVSIVTARKISIITRKSGAAR